ncbi:MAG TPA: hypothetical protein VFD58_07315 [Blastocatellia bacterium]|nr:hypothetical protein [Blastocatellia bacterium]
MKSGLTSTALLLGLMSPGALGQYRRGDRGRHCRAQYNNAVREANQLRGQERRFRLAQARWEFNRCERFDRRR